MGEFNRVGQINCNIFWLPELGSSQVLEPTEGRGQPRAWMVVWGKMAAQQLPPAAFFWQLVMSLWYKKPCLEVLNSSPWTKFTGWIQTVCVHTYSWASLWLPIRYKGWASGCFPERKGKLCPCQSWIIASSEDMLRGIALFSDKDNFKQMEIWIWRVAKRSV